MTAQHTASNLQSIARLTGLAYLGIVFAGVFAEFFVRMSLFNPESALATAENIARSTELFRAGLAADALMVALDVSVAVGFYVLFRQVNRPLAILAAALRLIQAAVLGANLMNMANALHWVGALSSASPMGSAAATEMVQSAMNLHRFVYDLGLIFFGLSCLFLGRLVWTSRRLPRALGVGLSISGAIYLVGSFAVILAPSFASLLDPLYGFTVLAELATAGWLAVKGVRHVAEHRCTRHTSGLVAAAALAGR